MADKMVTVTIDGKKYESKEGATVLEVAREHNIDIPTLCYNENLAPYGACRLCLVEVSKDGKGRKRLVTSCLYPVEEGLVVETGTPKVVNDRKMIMELLLARCPENKVIKDMAHKLGVEKTRFKTDDKNCVLCGLCVRACSEVVGASAISLVDRGTKRQVSTPYAEPTEACIGCGSCSFVCPIDAIEFEDVGDTRNIKWPGSKMKFKLSKCKACGAYWIPEKQIEYMCKKAGVKPEDFEKCPDCR